jgi:hypothetical protein
MSQPVLLGPRRRTGPPRPALVWRAPSRKSSRYRVDEYHRLRVLICKGLEFYGTARADRNARLGQDAALAEVVLIENE